MNYKKTENTKSNQLKRVLFVGKKSKAYFYTLFIILTLSILTMSVAISKNNTSLTQYAMLLFNLCTIAIMAGIFVMTKKFGGNKS